MLRIRFLTKNKTKNSFYITVFISTLRCHWLYHSTNVQGNTNLNSLTLITGYFNNNISIQFHNVQGGEVGELWKQGK